MDQTQFAARTTSSKSTFKLKYWLEIRTHHACFETHMPIENILLRCCSGNNKKKRRRDQRRRIVASIEASTTLDCLDQVATMATLTTPLPVGVVVCIVILVCTRTARNV